MALLNPIGSPPPPGVSSPVLPPQTLNPLRDLPHRVRLEPSLEKDMQQFLSAPPPVEREEQHVYLRSAEMLVERCIAFLDSEVERTLTDKFALGDASALQRRLIGEPRQRAGTFLAEVKNRLGAEKSRWTQRTKDQSQDVLDRIDEQIRNFKVIYVVHPAEVIIHVDEAWQKQLFKWLDAVLSQWAAHHTKIVRAKTQTACDGPVGDLAGDLQAPVSTTLPNPAPASARDLAEELPPLEHREELPTFMEAFFESLKGGLNTVAMLAGMVIVPVVGMFSDQQPIHVRALIMAGCVAPIILFAFWGTSRQRSKAVARSEEKALLALRKEFEGYLKTRIERFRIELERHAGEYVHTSMGAVVTQLEQHIGQVFSERESQLVRELARVQLESDKLSERIQLLRQAKSSLTSQLLVDLRRRQRELGG